MLNRQATNASALPTGCTALASRGDPKGGCTALASFGAPEDGGKEEPMYEPYKYWDPFVERDDGREEENQ